MTDNAKYAPKNPNGSFKKGRPPPDATMLKLAHKAAQERIKANLNAEALAARYPKCECRDFRPTGRCYFGSEVCMCGRLN